MKRKTNTKRNKNTYSYEGRITAPLAAHTNIETKQRLWLYVNMTQIPWKSFFSGPVSWWCDNHLQKHKIKSNKLSCVS